MFFRSLPIYRSYVRGGVERIFHGIGHTARPLVRPAAIACLLLFPLACMQTSNNGPASGQLGPGMARIDAEVERCAFDADPYICTIRVERIAATGPATTRPPTNASMDVRVYPSHFRRMTSDSLREHLATGRRHVLTVQHSNGDDVYWQLLRFE